MNIRIILLAGFTACFASIAMAQAPPKQFVLVLPENHEFVTHRIENAVFKSHVSFERNLLSGETSELRLSSVEPGSWKLPRVLKGVLVEAKDNLKDFASKTPTPAEPYQFDFKLKFRPNADRVEEMFAEQVTKFGVEAAKTVDPADKVKFKAEVKKLIAEYLAKQEKEGVSKLKILPDPKFLILKGMPEDTLKKLCIWIALDELMQHIPFSRPDGISDYDTLELWNDAIGVIYGSLKTKDDLRVLDPKFLSMLGSATLLKVETEFTPLYDQHDDDQWAAAARARFGAEDLSSAVWSGRVGADARASEWLAYQLATPATTMNVVPRRDSKDLLWTTVKGERGWNYLRVVPRQPNATVDFEFVVGDDKAPDAGVQIHANRVRDVKFPF